MLETLTVNQLLADILSASKCLSNANTEAISYER
jgi:hypothetical protein